MKQLRELRRRLTITPRISAWYDRQHTGIRVAIVLAALAAAIVIPANLEPRWQAVLFYPVGIFVLLALGLNIVVGEAGLLDLGYVAFFAAGAYTTAKLTVDPSGGGLGLNPWVALPLAILFAMTLGVLLG